jgi:hypothetical protein
LLDRNVDILCRLALADGQQYNKKPSALPTKACQAGQKPFSWQNLLFRRLPAAGRKQHPPSKK